MCVHIRVEQRLLILTSLHFTKPAGHDMTGQDGCVRREEKRRRGEKHIVLIHSFIHFPHPGADADPDPGARSATHTIPHTHTHTVSETGQTDRYDTT